MNARLETNLLRDWKPGWRSGIAANIADTSSVQSRRHKRHSRRAWKALIRVTFALAAFLLFVYLT